MVGNYMVDIQLVLRVTTLTERMKLNIGGTNVCPFPTSRVFEQSKQFLK
jgi:hypothetical protein